MTIESRPAGRHGGTGDASPAATVAHCTRRLFTLALAGASLMTMTATGIVRAQAQAQTQTAQAAPVVLVVGDSLSAEYGLERGRGWVALMEARIAQRKLRARVVNASISGDTTSGGRSRLPALLAQHKPATVIIELGGNDALRGLPLAMTRDNLGAMVQASKAAGASVLLLGMQVPPNYGRAYADDFAKLFGDIADKELVSVVPFLLRGVADGPQAEAMFQADRIHPNESAQATMLDNVWPALEKLWRL